MSNKAKSVEKSALADVVAALPGISRRLEELETMSCTACGGEVVVTSRRLHSAKDSPTTVTTTCRVCGRQVKYGVVDDTSPVELDCGDSSCYFATSKGGMRTNGGCRCLSNQGFSSSLVKAVREMLPELLRLRAAAEQKHVSEEV